MKNQSELQFIPTARREDLIVKRLQDELLVYDLTRHKAHCLNESAAAIWDLCDGITGVPSIARSLSKQMNVFVDDELVWMGIKALSRARLLTAPSPNRGGPNTQISRRRLIRKLGVVASAISLPIVASIIAPTAVSAASCATLGQSCANRPCCAGTGLGCAIIVLICTQL